MSENMTTAPGRVNTNDLVPQLIGDGQHSLFITWGFQTTALPAAQVLWQPSRDAEGHDRYPHGRCVLAWLADRGPRHVALGGRADFVWVMTQEGLDYVEQRGYGGPFIEELRVQAGLPNRAGRAAPSEGHSGAGRPRTETETRGDGEFVEPIPQAGRVSAGEIKASFFPPGTFSTPAELLPGAPRPHKEKAAHSYTGPRGAELLSGISHSLQTGLELAEKVFAALPTSRAPSTFASDAWDRPRKNIAASMFAGGHVSCKACGLDLKALAPALPGRCPRCRARFDIHPECDKCGAPGDSAECPTCGGTKFSVPKPRHISEFRLLLPAPIFVPEDDGGSPHIEDARRAVEVAAVEVAAVDNSKAWGAIGLGGAIQLPEGSTVFASFSTGVARPAPAADSDDTKVVG